MNLLTSGWRCPSVSALKRRRESRKTGLFLMMCLRRRAVVSITRCVYFYPHRSPSLSEASPPRRTPGDAVVSLSLTSTPDNVIEEPLRLGRGGAGSEMKSAGHSATISNALMWIPRSIVPVYPSVSPHMGLFLATENCAALRICAEAWRGEGLAWRAWRREKYSVWVSRAEHTAARHSANDL